MQFYEYKSRKVYKTWKAYNCKKDYDIFIHYIVSSSIYFFKIISKSDNIYYYSSLEDNLKFDNLEYCKLYAIEWYKNLIGM